MSRHFTRRTFFALPVAALAPAVHAEGSEYRFHHDHVMGTSLDLIVDASSARAAAAAEAAVFEEIGRLSTILSTYDPFSEISRTDPRSGAQAASPELRELLAAYEQWSCRTSGAISVRTANVSAVWKRAEALGRAPSDAELAAATPAWNLDALGKAFVVDRAARKAAPLVNALLLNVGGDILLTGRRAWEIGVSNPAMPHDNSAPLTSVVSTGCAVATSGDSARGFDIQGRRYSHIIDPRTNRPAEGAASATVLARDSVTANALATALCILPASQGLALVENTPAAEALIVERDGTERRSSRFAAFERRRIIPASASAAWPEGYQLNITLTLKSITSGRRAHRPYVAVWAEDASGKLVRNIAVWSEKPRYLPELHNWWSKNGGSSAVYSITRPTRPPGRYTIVWDGLDDKGAPVPESSYRIVVETNREHGDYAKESGQIDCGAKPSQTTLKETGEFEAVRVEYGPRKQVG